MERLFDEPLLQINRTKLKMKRYLTEEVINGIDAFADMETNHLIEDMNVELSVRFKRLNKEVYEKIKNQKSQEEYQQALQNFFQLTDVRQVTGDLRRALRFERLKARYDQLIKNFAAEKYGNCFRDFAFEKSMFNYLKQGLYVNFVQVTDALEGYAYKVKAYFDLLKSIRDRAGEKAFARITTSIAASLIIPFGSLAVRGLFSAFNTDEQKINDAINEVSTYWDSYIEALDQYQTDLRTRYKHILISLYGGLFISVQQQLDKHWIQIADLNLEEDKYLLQVHPKKQKDLQTWTLGTFKTVMKFITKGDLAQASFTANNFYM